MRRWLSGTFVALQLRHFRVLWVGTILAFVAFFMSTVVQSVVAYDLTEKNSAVGVVVFAQGLGQMLFGPPGGAAADRLSKRFVILVCQGTITVAFLAIGILLATDLVTVAFLALGSFAIGASFGFLGPARQSFMFEIVGPERRGNAIALSQGVALNGARIVGPALAGVALGITFIGKGGAYFTMAALYVGAIITTIMLPGTRPNPNPSGRSVLGDMLSGISYVWATPRLRVLILGYVLIIMMGFPYVTVLPGLVETAFDRDSDNVTILFAVSAAGGLLSSLWMASIADSPLANFVYPVASFLFGVTLIGTGLAPTWFTLAVAMFAVGVASGAFQTLNGALVAKVTDPEYFGRVISLTFFAFAAFGLMALPIGAVADIIGERTTLAIMGAVVCGVVAVFAPMDFRIRRAGGAAKPVHGEAGGGGR